jgi:hypothetical protein
MDDHCSELDAALPSTITPSNTLVDDGERRRECDGDGR